MGTSEPEVRIELLGDLSVEVDGRVVTGAGCGPRRAQELIALLALEPRRQLVRDQAIDRLWPHLDAAAGAANLRKAAHHARRAVGAEDALVLRGGSVMLFPGRSVVTDVAEFLTVAAAALSRGDAASCAQAAQLAGDGDLLPAWPYAAWTQGPRAEVRRRVGEVLHAAGRLDRLLELEPADEAVAREVMDVELAAGRRHTAIGVYERLRVALARELGAAPSLETRALYERCTDGLQVGGPPFVGRAAELGVAARTLREAADTGGARALIVRGETGIGKSALVREIAVRARRGGWRVADATATAAAQPSAPLAVAAEQLLVDGRVAAGRLPSHTLGVLAALAGEFADPAGAPTRHQVIGALRRVFALGDGAAPVLLCIEDAHVVDEATADVLHQLVVGGAGVPLVCVLALRAEWMRTSLPVGVRELARAERSVTVDLGPMSDDEVAALVADGEADAVAVSRIVAAAEGRPFFALELGRALSDGRAPLPGSVRGAIETRFTPLSAGELNQLTALAVGEGTTDLPGVRALTGLPEDEAFALLDAGLEAGILVVDGGRYGFRHELVRQALLDGVPPHRRVVLHRDAARRLAAARQPPEQVARHFLAGDAPREAVPFLLEAARRAVAVGAFSDARGDIERLLAVAPGHLAALVLRAEVLDALGDRGAPDAYAAAAAAAGPPEDQELIARRALAQLKASDPVQAVRTLEGVAPRSTLGLLAQALTYSAAAAVGAFEDAETAAAMADEAHRLALELGDPGAILDATWAHALAAHATGELPARLREYLRRTSALPEIATRVFDGQLCVTERMLHGGLPNAEVLAFADGLAAEAERLGAARGQAFALTLRGEAGLLAGALEQADRDFTDGARLHSAIGALAGEALSLLGRAQVVTAQGRGEHARPYLADALLMARESEVGHHTLDRVYGAMIEAADGEEALALTIESEFAIRGPAETCPTCRIALIVPAAIAAAQAGDLERAARYREDCAHAIAHIALPPAWHASAEEVYGAVALAEGRPEAAAAHFAAATDGFARWGQPLDAERCRRRLAGAGA